MAARPTKQSRGGRGPSLATRLLRFARNDKQQAAIAAWPATGLLRHEVAPRNDRLLVVIARSGRRGDPAKPKSDPNNPILNSPYEEPRLHYSTDQAGNLDYDNVRDTSTHNRHNALDYYRQRALVPPDYNDELDALNARVVSQFGEESTKVFTAG